MTESMVSTETDPAVEDPGVDVARANGVVTVTLRRPHHKNAVTPAGWLALRDALRGVVSPDDRALVLTGAGGDFCAGADIGMPREDSQTSLERMRVLGDAALALFNLPIPTIAKVDGVAVGAGMNLALACDLVVSSDRARYSEIFVKRGLSLDFGGSWLLPRLVGLRKAKEIAFFGEILSAEQAHALGLVHRVVPADDLDATVAEIVDRLRVGPPIAFGLTKAMLNNAFNVTLQQAVDDEARAQALNATTRDTSEAGKAFREKRQPEFIGR